MAEQNRIAQQSRLRWLDSPFSIALFGFALRITWIFLAHTYRFKTIDDNFGFGFEMGRIGRSLAMGEGFANPFDGITGPTAWEPPVYPYLIAGVFKIFGVYTRASAVVMLGISSIFSALTCVPIFLITRKCFDDRVAKWSAWAWAALPPVIFWCTRWVWETSLAALLLACIFWLTLCLDERGGWTIWAGWGLLWGVAALVNTSLLGFLPACGLWTWYRRAKSGKQSLIGIVLASTMFVACIVPWLARNYQAFGQFVFVRSNFGVELRLGNGPGANGTWMDYLHPTKNKEQLDLYQRMGEIAYVAERKHEAVEFIKEDYGRFARLSLKRFFYYWGGLPQPDKTLAQTILKNSWLFITSLLAFLGLWQAFGQKRRESWLFLWLLLFYPAIYYITFAHPRYRHPVEPELLILAIFAVVNAARRRVQPKLSS